MGYGMKACRFNVQSWRVTMNKLRELIDEPGFVLMILGFVFFMTLILTTPARGKTMLEVKQEQEGLIIEYCTAGFGRIMYDNQTACVLINIYAMKRVLNIYKDLSMVSFDYPDKDHSNLDKLKEIMKTTGRQITNKDSFDYVSILNYYETYLESLKAGKIYQESRKSK
jgi:hypothetical protein